MASSTCSRWAPQRQVGDRYRSMARAAWSRPRRGGQPKRCAASSPSRCSATTRRRSAAWMAPWSRSRMPATGTPVMVVPPGPLGIDPGRRLWVAFLDTPDGLLAVMVGGSVAGGDREPPSPRVDPDRRVVIPGGAPVQPPLCRPQRARARSGPPLRASAAGPAVNSSVCRSSRPLGTGRSAASRAATKVIAVSSSSSAHLPARDVDGGDRHSHRGPGRRHRRPRGRP